MSREFEWFYVRRKVCGKVVPEPTDLQPFDDEQQISVDKLLARNERNDQEFESTYSTQLAPQADYPKLGTIVYVAIFFGVRLENFLLNNMDDVKSFRFLVGLKNADEARIIDSKATSLKIYSYKDGARFGYFHQLTFDLIPINPAQTVQPYGKRYHIGVVYDPLKNPESLRRDLINFQFSFGDNGSVKYGIDRDTIKIKRSRKESPTL